MTNFSENSNRGTYKWISFSKIQKRIEKHLDAIPNTIQRKIPPFPKFSNLLHQIPIQKPKTEENNLAHG